MDVRHLKRSAKRTRRKKSCHHARKRSPPCRNNQLQDSAYATESLMTSFPLAAHFINYNEILGKLAKKKAQSLHPNNNNSSYEEWTKEQDREASLLAPSDDLLKTRIELARMKFIQNLNWEVLDVINFLVSDRSHQLIESKTPLSSRKTNRISAATQNPIVLMAVKEKRKITKAGLADKSSPAGVGKPKSKKTKKATPKSPSSSRSKSKSKTPLPTSTASEVIPEPYFAHKYKPTYKLSNWDYLKKGWTKLPDYSITYRVCTLGSEPAFPELWAFKKRTEDKIFYYPDTNKESANFEGDMPYFIYYPNGEVAISINDGRVGPRLIVYSMTKKDESGRLIQSRPQAMFDSKGNGVVYDIDGNMKMNYDQVEGALYLAYKKSRPVLHWYWQESTYLRMRRADLDVLQADRNDDIDPNKPDESVKSKKSSSKHSSKKTPKSGRKKSVKSGKKGKRKSKAPGKTKTAKGKPKNKSAKKKSGDEDKDKSEGKSKNKRQSRTGKKKGKKTPSKKVGSSKKRGTRADIPPLRKKPSHPRPIVEMAPIPVKITDFVSMRIVTQQHIHLDFECGPVHYRLYLGVNVKPEIVERIDKVVNPKKAANITPCYFELMPLRSLSLFNVNAKLKDMRKEAIVRSHKNSVKTLAGFYSWWNRKRLVRFQNNTGKLPVTKNEAE